MKCMIGMWVVLPGGQSHTLIRLDEGKEYAKTGVNTMRCEDIGRDKAASESTVRKNIIKRENLKYSISNNPNGKNKIGFSNHNASTCSSSFGFDWLRITFRFTSRRAI